MGSKTKSGYIKGVQAGYTVLAVADCQPIDVQVLDVQIPSAGKRQLCPPAEGLCARVCPPIDSACRRVCPPIDSARRRVCPPIGSACGCVCPPIGSACGCVCPPTHALHLFCRECLFLPQPRNVHTPGSVLKDVADCPQHRWASGASAVPNLWA
uniref:Uncharacterized protein n=1 Tax=Amazona collaria TaxID=241587 RepID=A0A8B9F6J0_9PSIT